MIPESELDEIEAMWADVDAGHHVRRLVAEVRRLSKYAHHRASCNYAPYPAWPERPCTCRLLP